VGCVIHRFGFRGRGKGFTLVELLLVLAVLGLVFGLALPAISGGLRKAREARCASNLKQLGVAWMRFATDHDGRLPSTGWKNNTANSPYPGILEYVGLPSTLGSDPWQRETCFTCPVLQAEKKTSTQAALWRTFSVNKYASEDYVNRSDAYKRYLNRIQRPSLFAVAMDGGYDPSRPANDRYTQSVSNDDAGKYLPQIQSPHQGFTHVLFADGHVGKVNREQIDDKVQPSGNSSIFWRDP
jgi:prepilin-type N-terminal cleavage/methylation domain-containing protein/prepilin-type processing-associated H-X9-DG protein